MPYSSAQRHHHNLCLFLYHLGGGAGAQRLQEYTFHVTYKPRKRHSDSDCLSRHPLPAAAQTDIGCNTIEYPTLLISDFSHIRDEQCRPWSNLKSHHNKPVTRHTICCSSVIPAPWPHLISALLPLSWFSLAPGCPRTPLPFYSILALTPIRLRKILRPWSISAAEAKEVLLVFAHSPGTEYGC